VRGLLVDGVQRGLVHPGIAVSLRPVLRRGARTSVDHVPVDVVIFGASLGCGQVSGTPGFFLAENEWPPGGHAVGDSGVVFDGAILIHIANAFVDAMLAGEIPVSRVVHRFLCIPIWPH